MGFGPVRAAVVACQDILKALEQNFVWYIEPIGSTEADWSEIRRKRG